MLDLDDELNKEDEGLLDKDIQHASLTRRFKRRYRHFTRTMLRKEDPEFYAALDEASLLDRLLPPGGRHIEDLVEFYLEHYEGVPRGSLRRLDPSLYQRMRKEEVLDVVPITRKQKRSRNFGGDYLAYCLEHHPGITRGELKKKDPSLYQILWKNDLLKMIPKKEPAFGGDPVKYYREHHPSVIRKRLRKENQKLYNRLMSDGFLHIVPTGIQHIDDPEKIYKEKYDGVTRTKLQKMNRMLYDQLRKQNKLGIVPTLRNNFGSDPLAYYHKHFKGYTRGQLYNACPGLYGRLKNDDLIQYVPKGKPGRKPRTKKELIAHLNKHHKGRTAFEVAKADRNFYSTLSYHNLLHLLPRKRRHFGDLEAYYHEHYDGVSQGRLSIMDYYFCSLLKKADLLHIAPYKKPWRKPRIEKHARGRT
ncbi:hypothetical protein KY349_02680 [Candidatus Woesearchaeota archaeon]|nr:hypothetical protein [Candidatus Woesearchaeota archaeon]